MADVRNDTGLRESTAGHLIVAPIETVADFHAALFSIWFLHNIPLCPVVTGSRNNNAVFVVGFITALTEQPGHTVFGTGGVTNLSHPAVLCGFNIGTAATLVYMQTVNIIGIPIMGAFALAVVIRSVQPQGVLSADSVQILTGDHKSRITVHLQAHCLSRVTRVSVINQNRSAAQIGNIAVLCHVFAKRSRCLGCWIKVLRVGVIKHDVPVIVFVSDLTIFVRTRTQFRVRTDPMVGEPECIVGFIVVVIIQLDNLKLCDIQTIGRDASVEIGCNGHESQIRIVHGRHTHGIQRITNIGNQNKRGFMFRGLELTLKNLELLHRSHTVINGVPGATVYALTVHKIVADRCIVDNRVIVDIGIVLQRLGQGLVSKIRITGRAAPHGQHTRFGTGCRPAINIVEKGIRVRTGTFIEIVVGYIRRDARINIEHFLCLLGGRIQSVHKIRIAGRRRCVQYAGRIRIAHSPPENSVVFKCGGLVCRNDGRILTVRIPIKHSAIIKVQTGNIGAGTVGQNRNIRVTVINKERPVRFGINLQSINASACQIVGIKRVINTCS